MREMQERGHSFTWQGIRYVHNLYYFAAWVGSLCDAGRCSGMHGQPESSFCPLPGPLFFRHGPVSWLFKQPHVSAFPIPSKTSFLPTITPTTEAQDNTINMTTKGTKWDETARLALLESIYHVFVPDARTPEQKQQVVDMMKAQGYTDITWNGIR